MKNLIVINEKKSLKVALYSRLSKDDGDKAESNSITNQRALLLDYTTNKLEDVKCYKEYVDDGYTGLNTDRPSFIEMIDDIKQGLINCVVVKDLSRFGRNSWEVGRYLEQIFPFLNVRFIAVNDLLDSETENFSNNMLIPFKNLINEAYSRDISQKVRSQLDIKRKQGDFISNFAPYGYIKDSKNKNKLVIDENVENVIRDIFKWRIEGSTNLIIADKLNSMGVLSPMEYKKSIGLNYDIAFKVHEKALWNHSAIGRILVNEVYIGNLIQGKTKSPNLKVKKNFAVSKDKQFRVCGTHEPIISRNDFDLVQEILKTDTKKSPNSDKLNVFSGVLKCNDCGESMVRSTAKSKGLKYFYYICGGNKYKKTCSSHRIAEDKVLTAVIFAINNEINVVTEIEKIITNIETVDLKNKTKSNLNNQLDNLNKELENYERYKKALFETYSKELIDEKFFKSNMETYAKQIVDVENKIEVVINELSDLNNKEYQFNNIAEHFIKYREFKEVTRALMVSLVETIEVTDEKNIIINFRHNKEFLFYKDLALEVSNG